MGNHKKILAAWGERCLFPGGSNAPVCVLEQDANGCLSVRWIQPDEQTATMLDLFAVSAAANSAMVRAVERQEADRG